MSGADPEAIASAVAAAAAAASAAAAAEVGVESFVLASSSSSTTTSSARVPAAPPTDNEHMTFPPDTPEDVMAAVKAWRPPSGHVSCLIPTGKDRSIIYNWGVRYEKVVENASSGSLLRKRPQWWACLASAECRDKCTVRKIDSNSTSGATQHLLLQHQKKSPRTQVTRAA